jgi:hypothetical protein
MPDDDTIGTDVPSVGRFSRIVPVHQKLEYRWILYRKCWRK